MSLSIDISRYVIDIFDALDSEENFLREARAPVISKTYLSRTLPRERGSLLFLIPLRTSAEILQVEKRAAKIGH